VDVSQGPVVPLRTVVAKTDTFELESVSHLGFHTYGSFLPCRVLFLDRTSPAFRGKSQYFLNSAERTEHLAEGRHDPRKQCDRCDDQHHVYEVTEPSRGCIPETSGTCGGLGFSILFRGPRSLGHFGRRHLPSSTPFSRVTSTTVY